MPSVRPEEGNEIDRPAPREPSTRVWGSDAIAAMLRAARHPLCRAQSRVELSRAARQPGQLPRQHRAAHAAVPARGERRGPRPRLGQSDRPAAPRFRARQCRADACLDGDLQRLVRPRAVDRARGHRGARRSPTAAVDRMDPHRPRPGRFGAQLHQMGRPARLGRGGAGSGVARRHDRADGAQGPGLPQFRPRLAGGRDRRPAARRPTPRALPRRPRPSPAARCCGRRPSSWRGRSGR